MTASESTQPAAAQDGAEAQYNLGNLYYTDESIPKDYAKAIYWYTKAAEQGEVRAQAYLGFAYYSGQGIAQDYKLALQWYRRAAQQNNKAAQMGIGYMSAHGSGITKSYVVSLAAFNTAGLEASAADQERLLKIMSPSEIESAKLLTAEMSKPNNFIKALDDYLAKYNSQ